MAHLPSFDIVHIYKERHVAAITLLQEIRDRVESFDLISTVTPHA
jgi:hypothetical protein